MSTPFLRNAAVVTATLAVALVPVFCLLPSLNDRAVVSWHILTFAEGYHHVYLNLPTLLLSVYVLVLLVRYVAFVTGSALEVLARESLPAAAAPNPETEGRPWPLVSIVVPAYNEGPVIQQSVRSLLRLDYPCYEVLVVDDGSTDDTYLRALEVSRGDRRVRVIRKRNGGKASALNVGMARAQGSLILNVDADSKLSTGSLRACVRHFRDPSVGAVAGNIKVANRENLPTRLQAIEYIQGLALERRAQSAIRAVSVIGGPLGVFRRSALAGVGGYESDTFAEDRDVTLKLLAQGWAIPYEPEAQAWAESPSRWLDLLSQRYRWTRGTVQALIKHRRALLQLRRQPVMCISLWYMALDSFVVPAVSLFMLGYFAYVAVILGSQEYLFLWLSLAALFDVAVTWYCLMLDREDMALLPSALVLRLYSIFTDVAKLLATFEELMHVDMTWGKLTREGKL